MKQQLQGAFTVFVLLLAAYGAYVVINDPPFRPTAQSEAPDAPAFDGAADLEMGDPPSLSIDSGFTDSKPPEELLPGASAEYDLSGVPGYEASGAAESSLPSVGGSTVDTSPRVARGDAPYGRAKSEPSMSGETPLWDGASEGPAADISPEALARLTTLAGVSNTSSSSTAIRGGAVFPEGAPRATATEASDAPAASDFAASDAAGLPRLPDMLSNAPQETWPRVDAPAADPALVEHADVVRDEVYRFLDTVCERLNAGDIRSMYDTLCAWYGDPNLTAAEQRLIAEVLDQATRTVVYSRAHLLESPYYVQPQETLESIARRLGVPWRLLAKINGIDDPRALEPGQELKILRGPINAIIDLSTRECVLHLEHATYGGRYAGRFDIGVGMGMLADQGAPELGFRDDLCGTYQVQEKERNPAFRDNQDNYYAPDDAENPLAGFRIQLSEELMLHGTSEPKDVAPDSRPAAIPGYICLIPTEMDHLFDILSEGSIVVIQE